MRTVTFVPAGSVAALSDIASANTVARLKAILPFMSPPEIDAWLVALIVKRTRAAMVAGNLGRKCLETANACSRSAFMRETPES